MLIITIDFVVDLRYNKAIEKRKAVVPMYDEQNSPASKIGTVRRDAGFNPEFRKQEIEVAVWRLEGRS